MMWCEMEGVFLVDRLALVLYVALLLRYHSHVTFPEANLEHLQALKLHDARHFTTALAPPHFLRRILRGWFGRDSRFSSIRQAALEPHCFLLPALEESLCDERFELISVAVNQCEDDMGEEMSRLLGVSTRRDHPPVVEIAQKRFGDGP